MKEKRKSYGYGPLYVLMGACLLVIVAIVMTLVLPVNVSGTDQTVESGQLTSEVEEASGEEIDINVKETEEIITVETEETLSSEENGIKVEPEMEEIPPVEESVFVVSDKTYFDDALFIGDSRTTGLQVYGTLDNADYFASAGLNLYTINNVKVEVEKGKKIKLEQMLTDNVYGKVYIMLGINELGYDFNTSVEKYRTFIEYIFEKQPQAIIYVCANMHVNSLRNELDEIHNNAAINRMNEQISSFADGERVFYLDVNPLFDDENGNLSQEFVSDDTHLMGIYYATWCDWYCQNTILIEN